MTASQFLAPHEYQKGLEPRIVRSVEHYIWWNGRKRGAIIALLHWPYLGRTIHVRFEDDDTSFAISRVIMGGCVDNFAPSTKSMRRRLHNAIRDMRLWRRFSFAHPDLGEDYVAFVSHDGMCHWVTNHTSMADFRFHKYYEIRQPRRFLIEDSNIVMDTPNVLHAKVAAALEDPRSDASFALAAARVQWRDLAIWREAMYDSQEPMRKLWRLVCRAYGPFDSSKYYPSLCYSRLDMNCWKNTRVEVSPDSPKLRAWGQALLHFAPESPRQILPLQYLCVRDVIGAIDMEMCYAERNFRSFTSHELLEARLELHDWANDNLPEEVIHTLEQVPEMFR